MLAAVATQPPDPPANAGPLTPVLDGLLQREPDDRLTGQVWVTVVATGLGGMKRRAARPGFESGAEPSRPSADPELPSFLAS